MHVRHYPALLLRALRTRVSASRQYRGGLLLNISIGGRLAVGFLVAACIAASVSGLIGMQRAQSLNRQSTFYQNLLQANTDLNTGVDYLQLMNTEAQELFDHAAVSPPSHETLTTISSALDHLQSAYDQLLRRYIHDNLLESHPAELAFLAEATSSNLGVQQRIRAASALRTWQLYHLSLVLIQSDVAHGSLGQGSEISISVQDRGPGIPSDELPLLFQKFVRLRRDLSGMVRGTGLGLYISKCLTESMQGRIWAESAGIAGQGSRFCFTLLAATSSQVETHPPRQEIGRSA